ncbi:hypothetical protein Zmor_009693 [Zophobas morio]|uniref:Uncharacterized protein n=1 Tax=Zophobas morio TaxID=2755281 RepID=A0AA38IJF0_9CUCU|nr:hypothetical protein Zmor_009693 [Zophobas morio]
MIRTTNVSAKSVRRKVSLGLFCCNRDVSNVVRPEPMDLVQEVRTHPSIIIIIIGFMATVASAIYVCINKNHIPRDKRDRDYHEIDADGQRVSIISDYSTNGEYTFYRGSPSSSRTTFL